MYDVFSHKCAWICSVCFVTIPSILNLWRTNVLTRVTRRVFTSREGTVYPSGALEFSSVFSGCLVPQYLVPAYYFVGHYMSFCPLSLAIVLTVFLRITSSFWLSLWYISSNLSKESFMNLMMSYWTNLYLYIYCILMKR